jgi:16S rRNA (adenine1518-N6/adenine1519-N6)-dimethyltransferase
MSSPFPDPRQLLKRHGLSAKKAWGQNFLISERVYRAIVDATVRTEGDWIIEYGSGLGTLTMRLAERVTEGKVIAIERDRDMVTVLEKELGHLDNIEVTPANALTFDLAAVARAAGERIAVCGNLPYHIGTRILLRVVENLEHVQRAVFMVQREVADRLMAAPSTKSYGALTLLVSRWAQVSKVASVPASAFAPPPKVESRVILLVPYADGPRVDVGNEEHFEQVVRAAFQTRRKTLRNALKSVFLERDVDHALGVAGIDGGRRGETLSLDEFARLSRSMEPDA